MTRQTTETRPEISIIVPVYKVERYLRQCLDSILAQTFVDWECIIVDDGSPDGCPQICDEYPTRDARFRVIHRPNGGLSAARNSGLHEAHGKYIGFIDSDDWIAPQMFERLYQLITEYGADMAQVSYLKEYAGYFLHKSLVKQVTVINRKELVRELLCGNRIPNYVCNKLFRKEVIDSEFPEGKVFEDIAVFNRWARNIRTAVLAPDTLYHYRMRKGSILHTDFSRWINYFDVVRERVRELSRLEPEALAEKERARLLWEAAINTTKDIARKMPEPESRLSLIQSIVAACQSFPPLSAIGTLGLKKYIRANLLLHHPTWFIRIMRAVSSINLDEKWRKSHLYD